MSFYNDIIDRIVEILKEDNIFNEPIRDISIVPTPNDVVSKVPTIHVILSTPYSVSESTGFAGGNTTQYVEKIGMQIIVSNQQVERSIRQLNDIMETVQTIFTANRTLANADGSDPMFIRSTIDVKIDQKWKGKAKQVATVTITGQVGEDITLKIKDLDRRLYVLHSAGNADVDDYAVHKDYKGELKGYVRTGRTRPRMFEIENTQNGLYQSLKERQDTLLTFDATHFGESESFNGYLKRVVRSINYNAKPVITLELASI